MRRLTTGQRRLIDEAAVLLCRHSGAISGFSRHTIETVIDRTHHGDDMALTPAELGIVESAVATMREAAGLPVPQVAE